MNYHLNGMVTIGIVCCNLLFHRKFLFPPVAWLRMRRLDPPTMEESMRNLQRIQKFKKSSEIISSKDIGGRGGHEPQTNFPKFHEYEQNPGSKYKPDK